MSFFIVKGDLFKQEVDAIVLTTSPKLILEGRLGGRALKICGDKLQMELNQLKNPSISECRITNAYNLPCKRIIHVATTSWQNGGPTKEYDLEQCYISCMETAQDFGLKSIAFPLLSAGQYRCPAKTAIRIAMEKIIDFTDDNDDLDVLLVIRDKNIWNSYKSTMRKYIIETDGDEEDENNDPLEYITNELDHLSWYTKDAKEILDGGVESQEISQRLKYFLKAKGFTAKECYENVLSKTAYEKIVNKGSIPDKYTLIALGISIGLDVYEIDQLLEPLGERINVYELKRDAIIRTGIFDFRPPEWDGYNRLLEINKRLISAGCVPLKFRK